MRRLCHSPVFIFSVLRFLAGLSVAFGRVLHDELGGCLVTRVRKARIEVFALDHGIE